MDGREAALEKIQRAQTARQGTYYLHDKLVTLAHGSGGKATHALIEGLFLKYLDNPELARLQDCAIVRASTGRLAFTTDTYVIDPIFFPGGTIGSLAIHGTINDLATSGARPLALSLALVLEEGFPLEDLERILASLAQAARAVGVSVVTGDTKVVPRGKCDRIFINTTGLGELPDGAPELDLGGARPGDRVLLSGPAGDHGIAVLAARGDLGLELDLVSDSAPLHVMVAALLEAVPGVRCLKDPTRGGVATALNEVAQRSGVAVAIDELSVPLRAPVRGACELLGLDPLYVANEGRLLAWVAPEQAQRALEVVRAQVGGEEAALIGEVLAEPARIVYLRTSLGGTRVLDMLAGAPMPRIC